MTDIVDEAQRREGEDRDRAIRAAAERAAELCAGRSDGICEDCADPIEPERLAIARGARTCLFCQEAREREGRYKCKS